MDNRVFKALLENLWWSELYGVAVTSSQIHNSWLGANVDSGIGLEYRPASLYSIPWRAGTRRPGRYDTPKPESTLSPQSVTTNLATVLQPCKMFSHAAPVIYVLKWLYVHYGTVGFAAAWKWEEGEWTCSKQNSWGLQSQAIKLCF